MSSCKLRSEHKYRVESLFLTYDAPWKVQKAEPKASHADMPTGTNNTIVVKNHHSANNVNRRIQLPSFL